MRRRSGDQRSVHVGVGREVCSDHLRERPGAAGLSGRHHLAPPLCRRRRQLLPDGEQILLFHRVLGPPPPPRGFVSQSFWRFDAPADRVGQSSCLVREQLLEAEKEEVAAEEVDVARFGYFLAARRRRVVVVAVAEGEVKSERGARS